MRDAAKWKLKSNQLMIILNIKLYLILLLINQLIFYQKVVISSLKFLKNLKKDLDNHPNIIKSIQNSKY